MDTNNNNLSQGQINTSNSNLNTNTVNTQTHNGYDANQLNPATSLTGFPVFQVSDASVAPTDQSTNGKFRYQVDNLNGTPHYYFWSYLVYADQSNNSYTGTGNQIGAWEPIQIAVSSTIPNIQTFTTSGTWTKPANMKYAVIEVQAPGGGGGTTTGGAASGGGGGGGGYSKKTLGTGSLSATETVTLGATSSFGAHNSATGGTNASGQTPGIGGIGSGGDINTAGSDGGYGSPFNGGTLTVGANGGASFYGGGGTGGASGSPNGGAGKNYGGGGGGATGNPGGGAGGASSPGIIIVTSYF